MTTKRLAVILIGIFCILGLSLAKTKAIEESSPTPTAKIDYSYYHVLYAQYEEAKTQEEKNAINVKIITGPVSAIEQDNELKYDALFRLMAGNPTKEQVQQVIAQFKKEKTWTTKKDILDALSYSVYKDITSPAYKAIAEDENESLFMKGLALHLFIQNGDEKEGYELVKKLFRFMDKKNELADEYNGLNSFRTPEMKEKVEKYLFNLRNDENVGIAIRCYAAILCKRKYKSDLTPYYPLIEKAVTNNPAGNNKAVNQILWLMYFASPNDQSSKNIIIKAAAMGNSVANEIIKQWKKF